MTTATNGLGTFGYSYVDATGWLAEATAPNGQTAQLQYFGNSGDQRLQEIKNEDSTGAVISQFDYAYNAVGDITTWTQNNPTLPNPRQFAFGYDAVDQLTSASLTDTVTSGVLAGQAYRYDSAGNRVTAQSSNAVVTEQANGLNQLTQTSGGGMMRFAGSVSKPSTVTVGGNAATVNADNTFQGYAQVDPSATTRVHIVATDSSGNVTDNYADITPDTLTPSVFAYDLNGNTVSSGPSGAPNVTYGWDAADRLGTITQGSNVTQFDYDGQGRRVRESLNGTEIRQLVWCGLQLCEERDATNTVTKRFYGQGEQIGGTNYYFTRDHLGSIREMTDASGGIHARYDYHLYGKRSANLVTTAAVDSDFGFTGHYFHGTSGLYLAPYREYDASIGRWLSRDPFGESGGINLYAYVLNGPTNGVDPLGLQEIMFMGEQPPIPPELLEQAQQLNGGRNRVSLPDGRDVDLAGKSHFEKATGEDIPTPHTHCPKPLNPPPNDIYPPGQGITRPSTLDDIIDAINHLGGSVKSFFQNLFSSSSAGPWT